MISNVSCILVCVCLALAAAGCHSPQATAKDALAAELTERRADRARSEALLREGFEAYRRGELDAAADRLRGSVRADGRNAAAWLALGVAEHDRRRFQEAAEAYQRASELVPSRFEPHYNLGTLLESVGRFDQAIEAYEAALEAAPDNLYVQENLARAYIRADRDLNRARRLVGEALEREYRPEWRQWLRLQSLRLSKQSPDSPAVTEVSP